MRFSIFFFSSNDALGEGERYRLVLDAARLGDECGFHAVWTPERHFHNFGGIFPSPAVLSAALATATSRIQLRAGSVVLPLHHPASVAEAWSVVDNLSGGRVGLAFASGYSPTDFLLAPDSYADRNRLLDEKVDVVRRLWRGESVAFSDGKQDRVEIRLHPPPVQRELPVWITCGGASVDKFAATGALGVNVLTALFVQTVSDLQQRIAAYRRARVEAGHGGNGQVTLMLHTYLDESVEAARAKVQKPFTEYLRSSVEVWAKGFKRLEEVPPHRREDMLAFAFERYFRTSALFGSARSSIPFVEQLAHSGVDEIACLVDFGLEPQAVMASLRRVIELRDRLHSEP